jgi:ATP-dependent exoDNAse (exonuclease V) alpha subunit
LFIFGNQILVLTMPSVLGFFPFTPNASQELVLRSLQEFVDSGKENRICILRGYAGTGKTSIMGALIRYMEAINRKSMLLAPTGRAAKVLSVASQKKAYTVHKVIYHTDPDGFSGLVFQLQHNAHKKTVFIVDEASMLGESPQDARQQYHLLDDLIQFVYSGDDCSLILLGDDAQLPPVGLDHSYSLFGDYYRRKFSLDVMELTLSEVMRQKEDSGILWNATHIRSHIDQAAAFDQINTLAFEDVKRADPSEFTELLERSYSQVGRNECIVITRSNKRANQINKHIRNSIFQYEDEITSGDLLMVVKNNYFWLDKKHSAGFIANGDFAEVVKVKSKEEKFGFRFAKLLLRFTDYPEEDETECMVLLDTLHSPATGLEPEKQKQLYTQMQLGYANVTEGKKRNAWFREDPYFNALHVKYGYAVTCHKSQGGQWREVYLDMYGWFSSQADREFLRWLYTAVTRASGKLFLLTGSQ